MAVKIISSSARRPVSPPANHNHSGGRVAGTFIFVMRPPTSIWAHQPQRGIPVMANIFVDNTNQRQEEEKEVDRFLADLYSTTAEDEHRAVDVIYNFIDDNLLAKRFQVCDLVFSRAKPEKLLPSGILSLLMVTQRAKDKMAARPMFISQGKNALSHLEGPIVAKALLGKYE